MDRVKVRSRPKEASPSNRDVVLISPSFLKDIALDWATAKADGQTPESRPEGVFVDGLLYRPRESWDACFAFVEAYSKQHGLVLDTLEKSATFKLGTMVIGYTSSDARIALCRALVGARLGDRVPVPLSILQASEISEGTLYVEAQN